MGYTIWMCLGLGILAPVTYLIARGPRDLVRDARETAVAAAGGIVSLVAYGIVIAAMALGPMGSVSALRETSVVFAALIGRFFLRERLTGQRLASCVIVAAGAVLIGYHG